MSTIGGAARVVAVGCLIVLAGSRVASAADAPHPRLRLQWSSDWPRFRWWEYAGTTVLGGAALYLREYSPLPDRKWQGANPFDDTIRGWLRADTKEGRALAGQVSDVGQWGSQVIPFALDLPVVLYESRSWDMTWQVLMMDVEASAVAGFINNGLFYFVGRGRPNYAQCRVDPTYDPLCGGSGNNASFPSGHTLGAATAAGLVCVHHRYLDLYGSPMADGAACAAMLLFTTATAVSRVMADRHYASDDLAGAGIGFATGYGLPWLLHYRHGGRLHRDADGNASRPIAVVPLASSGTLGVGIVGAL
jgi:hypothetical protein